MNKNIKMNLWTNGKDNTFRIEPNMLRLKWWEKLALFFIKPKVSMDWGAEDELGCMIFYKRFRGKVYIVGEKFQR